MRCHMPRETRSATGAARRIWRATGLARNERVRLCTVRRISSYATLLNKALARPPRSSPHSTLCNVRFDTNPHAIHAFLPETANALLIHCYAGRLYLGKEGFEVAALRNKTDNPSLSLQAVYLFVTAGRSSCGIRLMATGSASKTETSRYGRHWASWPGVANKGGIHDHVHEPSHVCQGQPRR